MLRGDPLDGRARPPFAAVVFAMGLVYLVWGSTFLAIRVSVETLPALLSAGLRFVVAGLLLAAVVAVRSGPGELRPRLAQLPATSGVGIWLLVGGPGLLTVAETRVPSNLAAVLASTTSIWVVLYALGSGERPRGRVALGVGVGFAGVALLLLPGGRDADASIPWLGLVLLSSLFWSSGSYYGRRLETPANPMVTATIQMLVAGVVLMGLGLAAGEAGELDLDGVSLESWLALGYLAFASAAAFSAYLWLLDHLPISTVVTHQYVNPVVAVVLGWAVLSEPLTGTVLAGAALVVAAVFVIVSGERSRASRG